MKILLPIGIVMVPMHGCKSNQKENQPFQITSLSDSLYKKTLALHDEAMPRIGKLMGFKKTVDHQLDSLMHIGKPNPNDSIPQKIQTLGHLKNQLNNAINAMNNWMDQFEPDPKFTTEAELESYFSKRVSSAQAMRDSVFAALNSAKFQLEERKK